MTIEDPFLDSPARAWRQMPTPQEPDRDYEHRILAMLQTHGEREGAALSSYRRVAEDPDAGSAIQYLVQLILEDEERHHRVFEEMANAIRSFVWEVDVEPKVPAMAVRSDDTLVHETERLLKFEKEDANELRVLRRAVKHGPKSSLHPLLVELMLHDTAKHIAILDHIRSRLRGH